MNLYVKQQPPGVLDHILDAPQEEDSLSAVDQPVVVCQREVHHWPREDVTIHNHRALHNGMHPKNCRLHFTRITFQINKHLHATNVSQLIKAQQLPVGG